MIWILLIVAYLAFGFIMTIAAEYFDIIDSSNEGSVLGFVIVWPILILIALLWGLNEFAVWTVKKAVNVIKRHKEME